MTVSDPAPLSTVVEYSHAIRVLTLSTMEARFCLRMPHVSGALTRDLLPLPTLDVPFSPAGCGTTTDTPTLTTPGTLIFRLTTRR